MWHIKIDDVAFLLAALVAVWLLVKLFSVSLSLQVYLCKSIPIMLSGSHVWWVWRPCKNWDVSSFVYRSLKHSVVYYHAASWSDATRWKRTRLGHRISPQSSLCIKLPSVTHTILEMYICGIVLCDNAALFSVCFYCEQPQANLWNNHLV